VVSKDESKEIVGAARRVAPCPSCQKKFDSRITNSRLSGLAQPRDNDLLGKSSVGAASAPPLQKIFIFGGGEKLTMNV